MGNNLSSPRRHRSFVEDCQRALRAVNYRLVWFFDSERNRQFWVRVVVERTLMEKSTSKEEDVGKPRPNGALRKRSGSCRIKTPEALTSSMKICPNLTPSAMDFSLITEDLVDASLFEQFYVGGDGGDGGFGLGSSAAPAVIPDPDRVALTMAEVRGGAPSGDGVVSTTCATVCSLLPDLLAKEPIGSFAVSLPDCSSPPVTRTPLRLQPTDGLRQGFLLPVVDRPRVVMIGETAGQPSDDSLCADGRGVLLSINSMATRAFLATAAEGGGGEESAGAFLAAANGGRDGAKLAGDLANAIVGGGMLPVHSVAASNGHDVSGRFGGVAGSGPDSPSYCCRGGSTAISHGLNER
ncbi:hypothetical protein Dimus_029156 [Dionaea muscipula]